MPTDKEADECAMREVAWMRRREATQCPWCGHWGKDFAESEKPSDYCHHDPAEIIE